MSEALGWGWGGETKGNLAAPAGSIATGNSNIPSGMGGSTWPVAAATPAAIPAATSGKYKNAEYNPITKMWSVFDGTSWSDGIKTADLYSQLDPEVQKQHSSWWWGDQANQGDYYHQRENDTYASDAQRYGALSNTSYKYNSPVWG